MIHSKLGASSYSRWGECPGSVALSEGEKGSESKYAEEGTRAHDLAQRILSGQAKDQLGEADDEMLEAVGVYVDYVNSLRDHPADKIWFKIEQKFDLSKYHPALFGTADFVIYFYETKRLVVVDYKHGAGIPVNVVENGHGNKQLMYYGIGAIQALNLPVQELELVIVQPRCYHSDGPIRKWSTQPMSVMAFLADLIDDAIATEQPNAPLKVGDWCRWCPAQAKCPALREKALVTAKEVFSQAESYSPEKLSETLHALPQIEGWIKGVREFAYREAQHGRIPPGWKLVQKRATRKWRDGTDEGKIASEFGLKTPECYDVKIKSPAQIEKLIPKELKKTLESMVVQESSGFTLAPDSDPRQQVLNQTATDAFRMADEKALLV